jgi:hypothetical protein
VGTVVRASGATGMIPPVLRTTLSLLVLAACSALVAACGESGSDPVSKARAVAYANAVNLRAGDLRGMTNVLSGYEVRSAPPFGVFDCATHMSRSDEVVALSSPWFLRSTGQPQTRLSLLRPRLPLEATHSVVYVMRAPAFASRNVAAAGSPSARACVERRNARLASGRFVGRELLKRQIKVASLTLPQSGIAGFGMRVSGTLAAAQFHQKTRPAFYEDTFGFAVGPAEIVLRAGGVARPFPSAVERRLLSVLYARAKAHALS